MRGIRWTVCRGVAAAALLLAGCASGPAGPAELDTRNARCAHCAMVVSDRHTAAQVVAPGEEPRFFDDIGCLTGWLRERPGPLEAGAMVYVADHRTGEWAAADTAIFTKVPGLSTPMGSGIVAHASADSRAQDGTATNGEPVPGGDVLAQRWRRQ